MSPPRTLKIRNCPYCDSKDVIGTGSSSVAVSTDAAKREHSALCKDCGKYFRIRPTRVEIRRNRIRRLIAAKSLEKDLTSRERNCLESWLNGKSMTDIGDSLKISKQAVSKIISKIEHYLGLEEESHSIDLTRTESLMVKSIDESSD